MSLLRIVALDCIHRRSIYIDEYIDEYIDCIHRRSPNTYIRWNRIQFMEVPIDDDIRIQRE